MSEEPAKYHVHVSAEHDRSNKVDQFEKSMQRVTKAHDELLKRLFGFTPDEPRTFIVEREDYTKAMKSVQRDFDLMEGDPDFVLFILEQLSRPPRFTPMREDER